MARGRTSRQDNTTLEMALVGYEIEKKKIEDKIQELERILGRNGAGAAAKKAPSQRKPLSASARRRIAAAQKRRWAEHRRKMAQTAKG